ncbi:hypothetical protein ACVWY0_001634 [Arthrobacter sp. UYNi723]
MPYNDAASRAKARASMLAKIADPNDQWLERNRQARLGKPSRGGHVTKHVKLGIYKPETCVFCREEQEANGG